MDAAGGQEAAQPEVSGSDSNPLALLFVAGALAGLLILGLWEHFDCGARIRRWLGGR